MLPFIGVLVRQGPVLLSKTIFLCKTFYSQAIILLNISYKIFKIITWESITMALITPLQLSLFQTFLCNPFSLIKGLLLNC